MSDLPPDNVSRRPQKRKRQETSLIPDELVVSSKGDDRGSNVCSQTVGTVDSFTKELQCPVCLQLLNEPYATFCGHTFCRQCIEKTLLYKNRCPKCNFSLDKTKHIFPNNALANLAQHCRETQQQFRRLRLNKMCITNSDVSIDLAKCFSTAPLDLSSVHHLINLLNQRRMQLEQGDRLLQTKLLKEFLLEMIVHHRQNVDKLNKELKVLETDLKSIEADSCQYEGLVPSAEALPFSETDSFNIANRDKASTSGTVVGVQNSFPVSAEELLKRRRRMRVHFDDLEAYYLTCRASDDAYVANSSSKGDGLERFTDGLTKLTQFNGFRRLATLNYDVDLFSGLNIVSSIEFDRDGEYFAIAGVTKKIKLYDYGAVLEDCVDIHYPVGEMPCNSKISCISWNPYMKNMLASSDYEGVVQLWDVYTNKCVTRFTEHEKRSWSVCFNFADPTVLASGSDDAKVKLWSTNSNHSVATLDAHVNVCCVHFDPESRYHIAFGSADHRVHYYDLRNLKQPAILFKGHKKAVSYVKFMQNRQIISASTDSQLRLWSVNNGQCIRTFTGHQNEKNFVGLATDGDYIACGSENNHLYVYYKELSKPVVTFPFGAHANDRERLDAEGNDFVSAVCWKKNTNVVLAANSQGTIRVLELD